MGTGGALTPEIGGRARKGDKGSEGHLLQSPRGIVFAVHLL